MKKNFIIGVIAAMFIASSAYIVVYAQTGTVNDPLITLSYLNDVFLPKVLEEIDATNGSGNSSSGNTNDGDDGEDGETVTATLTEEQLETLKNEIIMDVIAEMGETPENPDDTGETETPDEEPDDENPDDTTPPADITGLSPEAYEALKADITASLSAEITASNERTTFYPINLKVGQRLIALDGGMEVLLRTGEFTSVVPAQDLLINMTKGTEVSDGKELSLQNTYLVARADGRGVQAETDSWLMVRGSYVIEAPIE